MKNNYEETDFQDYDNVFFHNAMKVIYFTISIMVG